MQNVELKELQLLSKWKSYLTKGESGSLILDADSGLLQLCEAQGLS